MPKLGLVLAALLILWQDPAEQVRALVEQLKSDDIAERETAHAALLKFDVSVVPALRKAADRETGEAKNRLNRVIDRIERQAKLAAQLTPALRVNLDAKNMPAKDVFAELTRQTGIPVEAVGLPDDLRLTFEAKDLHLSRAIDALCRAHGGLMHAWSLSRVRVYASPYRRLPMFEHGPFVLYFSSFHWNRGTPGNLWLAGGVVGPPDRFAYMVAIDVESATDDQGTDLRIPAHPNIGLTWLSDENEPERRLGPRVHRSFSWFARKAPSADAAKLTSFRGRLRVHIPLKRSRVLTFKAPEHKGSVTESGTTLSITGWSSLDRSIRLEYLLSREIPALAGPWDATFHCHLLLRDAKGKTLRGVRLRLEDKHEEGETVSTQRGIQDFEVPDGFAIEAIDVERVEDTEEISIPFDLGEVPLQ